MVHDGVAILVQRRQEAALADDKRGPAGLLAGQESGDGGGEIASDDPAYAARFFD